jgi:O-antigen/teichoic acid export membrane protein
VPAVIRTVAYPSLVRLAAAGAKTPLARAVRRVSLAGGLAGAAASCIVLIGYPWLAAWFAPAFLDEGVRVLQPLLLGMTAYAFFVPFDQLLLQSGLPGRQSLLMTLYVLVNVTLNLLLIPRMGLRGAAIATAIALVTAGVMLLVASWRWLGFRHGVLFYSERTV